MQQKVNIKSPGRRSFIRTVIYSGAGATFAPLTISCGGSNKKNVNSYKNLLTNGDFEQIYPSNLNKPADWEVGPQAPGKSVTLTGDVVQSGSKAALQRRTASEDYYYYLELWGLSQHAASFDDIRIYSIPLEDEKILSLAKRTTNLRNKYLFKN